jgi:hypothetical protein
MPTAGPCEGAVSYEQGTPVTPTALGEILLNPEIINTEPGTLNHKT